MIGIPEDIREYTHQKMTKAQRIDFTQTLKYVSAQPVNNNGTVSVSFDLSD